MVLLGDFPFVMFTGVIYLYESPSGKYYVGQTARESQRRCLFLNKRQASTGRRRLFSKTSCVIVSFRDYLRVHPLCRRSKRLKSNSMVVPFRCADFLGQLVALEE